MTHAEAVQVVTRLFAAFPDRHRPPDTKAIYVEHVEKLNDHQTALAVVASLESSASWLPTIATVEESYREYRRAHPLPALPEPELTPQERSENVRKMHVLLDQIEGHVDMDEALKEVAGEMQVVRDEDRTPDERDMRHAPGRGDDLS
jgi:hypothetical protein